MENPPIFGGMGQRPLGTPPTPPQQTTQPAVEFNEPGETPRVIVPPHVSANTTPPLVTTPEEKEPSFWGETFKFVVIAILIALPIRFFIMQPFIVSGESMADNFHNSDYLIIDELSYRFNEPARGDVIVFKNPRNTAQYYIKRIIGLPGETIKINGSQVEITNPTTNATVTLSEPYITKQFESVGNATLGADEYYVLGDNRGASSDSRIWGVLKRDLITGRAILRLWPPAQIGLFPAKATY